jgi:hypothetical protein
MRDGLTDCGQRLDVLVKAELLETDAALLQLLKLHQVRFEGLVELASQRCVHLLQLLLVVVRGKFCLVLDEDALL